MKSKYHRTISLTLGTLLLTSTSLGLNASDSDDRIESAARKSYVFKTYLKDDSITTEANNGAVILTGSVAEESHKALAGTTVENLPGVVSVDNQLRVTGVDAPEYSDMWLGTKVKTTLLFHRNVSGGKTDVYVKDGVVSLRGEASSMAQRELATEYAKDVDGVKSVKNEMTVAKLPPIPADTTSEQIDDASITAQVKVSLLSHHSTSAVKTAVRTQRGVVTITGIARNDAEKSLVTKLASDIAGVVSVTNDMTIAALAIQK